MDDVNRALKAVGCRLLRDGMCEFVTRALVRCWRIVKDQHFEYFMRPIEEFRQEKKQQKDFFVASIKQDKKSDEVMAEKLAQDICKELGADMSKRSERICKQVVARNADNLERKAIQEVVDAVLGTDDLTAQERNIRDPAVAIEAEFDRMFESVNRQAMAACESDIVQECELQLMRMISFVRGLRHLLGIEYESTMSEQVFELGCSHSGGPAVTRAVKRWAAGHWLRSSVLDAEPSREWETPDLWNIGHLKVHVRDGRLKQHCHPISEECLREAVHRAWQNLDDVHIGCMEIVLDKMGGVFQDSCSTFKAKLTREFEEHLDRTRLLLRSGLVPCKATCPCCGRICDSTDLGSDHIHCCSSGHQCRGFMGIYLQDGKRTASTRICSQVDDDDVYIDEVGRSQTWREFKASRPDWDFTDKFEERSAELQVRMLQAWAKVGPKFCDYFNTRWTPLGEEQTLGDAPTHFILVLDSSGSMRCEGWTGLHQAVVEMFKACKRNPRCTLDRFSAIAFAASCKRLFLYEEIEQAQEIWTTCSAPPTSGGTSYYVALQGAVSILRDCSLQKHHRITLVFMSDGADDGDERLEAVVQELKNEVVGRHFKAFTIAFGSPDALSRWSSWSMTFGGRSRDSTESVHNEGEEPEAEENGGGEPGEQEAPGSFARLQTVAQMLGGRYVTAVTDMDLSQIFVEIAQKKTDLPSDDVVDAQESSHVVAH